MILKTNQVFVKILNEYLGVLGWGMKLTFTILFVCNFMTPILIDLIQDVSKLRQTIT